MKKLSPILLLLSIIFIGYSCKKDDPEPEIPATTTEASSPLDAVINTGESFPDAEAFTEEIDETSEDVIIGSDIWNCTTTTVNFGNESGGDSGFPLFNPAAEVIYPGALLQGASLLEPTPELVFLDRGPGRVTITNNQGFETVFVDVDEVANSTVTQAMNDIIADAIEDNIETVANFNYSVERIYSAEHLTASLGLSYEGYGAEVEADFNYSSVSNQNNVMVRMNQAFYTMAFEGPSEASEFLAESVTPEQLQPWVSAENPLTYISSVTYGRIYYMLFSSTSDITEMEANLNSTFSTLGGEVGVEGSLGVGSEVETYTLNVKAFGGGLDVLSAEPTDLGSLGAVFAATSDINTGVPVSYVVRELSGTRPIVGMQLNTSYEVVECELYDTDFPPFCINWSQINDVASEGTIGSGGVTALYTDPSGVLIAFVNDGDEYVQIAYNQSDPEASQVEGPFPMDNLFPPFDGQVLSDFIPNVGAIDYYRNNSNISNAFPDIQGYTMYNVLGGTGVHYIPSIGYQTFVGLPQGQNQTSITSVGALNSVYVNNPSVPSSTINLFSGDGNTLSAFNWIHYHQPDLFTIQFIDSYTANFANIGDWAPDVQDDFGGVGASTYYTFGAQTYEIVVNEEGTMYMLRPTTLNAGDQGAWLGPYSF